MFISPSCASTVGRATTLSHSAVPGTETKLSSAIPVLGLSFEAIAPSSAIVQAERDDEIVAQGDAAEYCYQVISGCVRTVRLLEDGRRQIGEFLFAGDVFGWDTLGEHEFSAEAVTPVTLRRLPLHAIEDQADHDRTFAHSLYRYTSAQIRAARARLVLLGRKTAAERVASFLLEMRDRASLPHASAIELPMSRADMADYLGLTIETVCRCLTELRRKGTIAINRSRIAICDDRALDSGGSDRLH